MKRRGRARVSRFAVAALAVALAIALVHGASALCGLGEWVGVLSGTPVPGVSLEVAALGAAVHVASWLALVVVAPVLVIAAALESASRAVLARASRTSSP